MTYIKKLHLDAIEESKEELAFDLGMSVNEELAASKSAEITQQIAVEFFNWVDKMIRKSEIINKNNGSFYYKEAYFISEELFQEFLKTKS